APSEETGEMVVAHVVLKDPAVSIDVLRAHARTQLTGYKVPRRGRATSCWCTGCSPTGRAGPR
ncbi:hypothetical protein OMR07_24790, partial [Methylobacterium organophilum]|nr:hypothetical protein [Methylobacterium organophilum]